MNKIRFTATGLLLFTLLMANCESPGSHHDDKVKSAVKILIHQDTIPVLIGKEMNPVLRINVLVPEDMKDKSVSEIAINLSETFQIEDIALVSIFHTNQRIEKGDGPKGLVTLGKIGNIIVRRQ